MTRWNVIPTVSDRPTVKTPTTTIVFYVCVRRRQRCVEYVLYLNFVSFHCSTVRLGRIGVLFRLWIYLFNAAASPHYHIQALAHTTQTDIIDVLLCFAFVLHVRRFFFLFFLRFFVSNLGRSTLCIHTDGCCWQTQTHTHLNVLVNWSVYFVLFVFFAVWIVQQSRLLFAVVSIYACVAYMWWKIVIFWINWIHSTKRKIWKTIYVAVFLWKPMRFRKWNSAVNWKMAQDDQIDDEIMQSACRYSNRFASYTKNERT